MSPRRRLILAWPAFLLVLFALAGAKFWQNHQFASSQAKYALEGPALYRASNQFYNQATQVLRGPSFTQRDFEIQLNGGKPFATVLRKETNGKTYDDVRLVNPATGGAITLSFSNGEFRGMMPGPVSKPARPLPPPFWFEGEWLRDQAMVWMPCLYVALLLVLLGSGRRKHTRMASQAMLATVLVLIAAVFLSPYGWRPTRLSDDRLLWLIWTAAMLVLATVAILHTYRRHGLRGARRCDFCGYDLRGNTTGICPECGQPLSARFLMMLDRQRARRQARAVRQCAAAAAREGRSVFSENQYIRQDGQGIE